MNLTVFAVTSHVIATQGSSYTISDLANLSVAVAILIAGGLSVFYIFVGGISFILAAGQEDKIKQAVHTIRYAIIGLVVTFIAVAIVSVVGRILGFNIVAYLSWDRITELFYNLVDAVFDPSGGRPGGSSLQ